jgi:SAM-dependent methyltransferase
MSTIIEQFKSTVIHGNSARKRYLRIIKNRIRPKPFPGSAKYWEERYASGDNSGVGSYGKFASFKAEVVNNFVTRHGVTSVIEFGCGDGNQLELANYQRYLGLDVSETVVLLCKQKFASHSNKAFKLVREYEGETADLSLSLDVIYHLVEDEVFEKYMRTLFKAAIRYVIVYSSNFDSNKDYKGTHVRHRKFTDWIQQNVNGWKMIDHIPNRYPFKNDYKAGSPAGFFLYKKANLQQNPSGDKQEFLQK